MHADTPTLSCVSHPRHMGSKWEALVVYDLIDSVFSIVKHFRKRYSESSIADFLFYIDTNKIELLVCTMYVSQLYKWRRLQTALAVPCLYQFLWCRTSSVFINQDESNSSCGTHMEALWVYYQMVA